MSSLTPMHWLIVVLALAVFAIPVIGITYANRRKRDRRHSASAVVVAATWTALQGGGVAWHILTGGSPNLIALLCVILDIYWLITCIDANKGARSPLKKAEPE